MGTIHHHAIVVTSWKKEAIEAAHQKAKELGCEPTEITPETTNGYRSFLTPPDGSKEGWEASDEGDARRWAWIASVRSLAYDDGSSPLEWFEARYGSDMRAAIVVRSEWPEEEADDDA